MLFEMENYEGDLTDIVRGRSKTTSSSSFPFNYACKPEEQDHQQHQLLPGAGTGAMNNHFEHRHREAAAPRSSREEEEEEYSFGDPFCADLYTTTTTTTTHNSSSSVFFNNGGCGNLDDEVMMKRPPAASNSSCNIFSRMLQISPASTTNSSNSIIIPNKFPSISDHHSPSSSSSNLIIIPNSNNSPTTNQNHHLFLDNNNINMNPSSLQISSPRNPPGIKRRKSQARKVVCVPAPVAASSRPNGEVIPSDLWAWRKYGQKPIKGSPYPRGYYRCSSSKGCSARKQVERSRTDPNMLVITYTSEHNHPWPTQRNALAGSSRSQQSKNNSNSKLPPPPSTNPSTTQLDNNNGGRITRSSIKEELIIEKKQLFETTDQDHNGEDQEGFQYNILQSDDFFADLEELETDHPLNLLFSQAPKLDQINKGGGGGSGGGGGLDDVVAFNNLFNWGTPENNNNNNNNSFEDHPPTTASINKRGFY